MNDEWLVGLDEYDTPGRPSVDDDLAVALDLPADHPVHLTAGPAYDEDEDPDDYPAVYAPQVVPPWTTALVFDVALGLDAEDVIFRRHNITREEWEHISTHPMFNAVNMSLLGEHLDWSSLYLNGNHPNQTELLFVYAQKPDST